MWIYTDTISKKFLKHCNYKSWNKNTFLCAKSCLRTGFAISKDIQGFERIFSRDTFWRISVTYLHKLSSMNSYKDVLSYWWYSARIHNMQCTENYRRDRRLNQWKKQNSENVHLLYHFECHWYSLTIWPGAQGLIKNDLPRLYQSFILVE